MNSLSQRTPDSRVANLSPFEFEMSVARSQVAARARPTESGAKAAPEYGCVDWFQYPVPPDPAGRTH